MGTDSKKTKALDLAINQIDRQFGKGAIMRMGDDHISMSDNVISTGCLSLDVALGVGGVPKGRIIEIFGPESSGKTTLTLHVVAEAQKAGGYAAFIDAEHAMDPEYAKNLGVNLDELLVSQPDSGEQSLEITETLVRSGALDVIVVDSVAALVPRAELEGEMGDSHMGLQARLMSQALRKLTGTVSKSNTTVIFVNQIREKIGVMFGNPETTPGGRALKFYSSVRMDIRRITSLKDGTDMVGNRTRVKVVKNKVAPPFKMTEFDIMYGKGISKEGDIIDLAIKGDIVEKMGAWFSYGDMKIGQGKENSKKYLLENPDIYEEIIKKVRSFMGLDVDEKNKVIKVESIYPKKKNKELFFLKLSNGSMYEISKDVLISSSLRQGQNIEKSFLDDVLEKQLHSDIKCAALSLLSYRMRSQKELYSKLMQKGYPSSPVKSVISKFEKKGWLNDHEFGLAFSKDQINRNSIGPISLKYKLKEYIDSDELISVIVKSVYADMKVDGIIYNVLKRFEPSKIKNDNNLRQKLINKLKRKGHYWQDIDESINNFIQVNK